MNKEDDIPRVSKEATLREALVEITRKKLGMTVICDDNMLINGIFTDGDLRRIFDLGIDLNNAKISDVMTKGGIRISPDSLAVEALNLMQAKHITSLLVTEPDSDILLGVLHMHDLLQAGVVSSLLCAHKDKDEYNDRDLLRCSKQANNAKSRKSPIADLRC